MPCQDGGFRRERNNLKVIEWKRFASLTIAMSTLALGCVAPNVYNIGVRHGRMEFQSVSVAPDGDLLLAGTIFEDSNHYKVYAYQDARSLRERIHREFRNERNVIQICGPGSRSSGMDAWKIIPADLPRKNVARGQVPIKFISTTQVYSAVNPVPYLDEGKTLYLQFYGLVNQWSERAAWSYPCQILLVPAAAIDLALGIVWVPIWLIFFSHEH